MNRTSVNAILCALVGLSAGAGACSTSSSGTSPPTHQAAPAPTSFATLTPALAQSTSALGLTSLADVADKTMPAVVNVYAERVVRGSEFGLDPFSDDFFFRHFFGRPDSPPRDYRRKSLGSGVVISDDGLVITNSHVIDGAEKLRVSITGGPDLPVEVIGSDPKSDVALLRVSAGLDQIEPLRYGDSSKLRPGDLVLAIGNPFGVGQTVTMGIISATGRANVGIAEFEDFLQTDAAINPGNSGGALINTQGQVIGINTAMMSRSGGYQGVGFAIPSNMVQEIARSLLAHGEVARGFLGVAIQTLDPDLAMAMKLSVNEGVVVSDVTADSPAQKAGLKRGDVLVEINGKAVKSSARVRNLIASAGAGAVIEMQVLRNGQRKKVVVTLGALPTEKTAAPVTEVKAVAGMSLETLTDEIRRKYDIPESVARGVVVSKVAQGSPASDAGIRVGDVIVEVDETAIDSARAVRKRYEASESRLLLLVNRKGTTLFVAIRK